MILNSQFKSFVIEETIHDCSEEGNPVLAFVGTGIDANGSPEHNQELRLEMPYGSSKSIMIFHAAIKNLAVNHAGFNIPGKVSKDALVYKIKDAVLAYEFVLDNEQEDIVESMKSVDACVQIAWMEFVEDRIVWQSLTSEVLGLLEGVVRKKMLAY